MVSKDVKFSGSKEVIDKHTNVSWAAIHTSQAPEIKKKRWNSSIESTSWNMLAMVKHCLTVILWVHAFTNLCETPSVIVDQLLFALLKIIQWHFWETLGEKHIVRVLGAIHKEKAARTCTGQTKVHYGSTALLAENELTTIGVAESCIHCAKISPSPYINIGRIGGGRVP